MDNKLSNINIFDFDYASEQWKLNKIYLGRGVYKYKCNHISETTNKYCKNKRFVNIYCKYHAKIYNNKNINK
jgi:hypothetical protein